MNADDQSVALRHRLVLGIGAGFCAALVAMFAGQTIVLAWSISLILTLGVALGAVRDGSLGPFRPYLIGALVVWVGAFTLMHLLPAGIEHLVLGLPPATAVALGVLWLAPLFLVTLPYGLYFDRAVLSEAQVAELERRRAEREQ